MAPYAADTAVASRKQPRRPMNRIVPAVPFALSRPSPSAKTSTPEETATETFAVTQPVAEPHPTADQGGRAEKKVEKAQEEPTNAIQAPPTPESKASDTYPARAEEPPTAIPSADAQDGASEKSSTQGQFITCNALSLHKLALTLVL